MSRRVCRSPVVALPLLLMAVLLAACQAEPGGPLAPVRKGGGEIASGDVVQVENAGLSARITARWSARGAQSMRIRYRNAGAAPVRIMLKAFALSHTSGNAALWTAVDATGVDLADARSDNDRPIVLYTLEGSKAEAPPFGLPPGATRDLDLEFTSFSNARGVAAGDGIVATVPLGDRSVDVAFTAGRAPMSPF